MDSQWLAFFLGKATVLLVAGVAAALLLRRAAASARHLVWLATLTGLLLLPGLLRLAPVRLEILPAALVASSPFEPARDAAVSATPAPERAAAPFAAVPAASLAAPRPARAGFVWPTRPQALFFAWAAGVALILGRLAAGSLAARRLVRAARPFESARWTALLRDLSDRLDVPDTPRLLASESVEIPFACGFWRTTIVLPASADQWPEDRRQMVLLHELAHVRRRDLLGQALGRLACAAYWFHPLVWTAARRLRAESERACDDLVLACGARASDYAGHLLDILAASRGHGAPATALPMARRREFEGRLLAILDATRQRRTPGRVQATGLVAALAAVLVAVAATAPAPPVQASPDSPFSLAERGRGEGDQYAAQPDSPPQKSARNRAQKRSPASPRQPEQPDQPEPEEQPDNDEARHEAPAAPRPLTEADRERRDMVVSAIRTDPDASVRRSAAWALADRTQPAEAGVLIGVLRDDADAGVREMAAWALADVRSDDVAAALGQALRKDASAEVRATAAWALGQRRRADPAALAAAVGDASPDVREAAIWALGQHHLDSAPAAVVAALRDGEPRIRLVTAWALGEILDPTTAAPLRAAFAKEEDVEVRRAIFRALAYLGDRSPEYLDRAAAAKDPELRSRAIMMLGGVGPGFWPWPWPWPQPRPRP